MNFYIPKYTALCGCLLSLFYAARSEDKSIACVDTIPVDDCEFMHSFDWCDEDVDYLKTKCDKTCEWCSDGEECVDKATYANCGKLTKAECNQYAPFYLSRCKKSCGWCGQAPKGLWSNWQSWGACTTTCGKGFRLRERDCVTNNCDGRNVDVGKCQNIECPTWTEWGKWSRCSVTCSKGEMSRKRHCNYGPGCVGDGTDWKACLLQPCGVAHSLFDVWSECGRTCGGGTRMKVISCPEKDLTKCPKVFEDCNTHRCPFKNCYTYRYKSFYSSCCNEDIEVQCGRGTSVSKRIIGGEVSSIERFPWMARIELVGWQQNPFRRKHLCGGSLIHSQYVLTAAHCLQDVTPAKIEIVLGAVSRFDKSPLVQRIKSSKFIIHPDYSKPLNDVAIVKLKRPATTGTRVNTICLPNGEVTPIDTRCMVAGWGLTHFVQTEAATNLMEVDIRHLPFEVCAAAYKHDPQWKTSHEGIQMCAGKVSGGADTCRGDSGGPLMCQRCNSCSWYVAGVTSFGTLVCGAEGAPGVYVRMTKYEDWVATHVPLSDRFKHHCNL